MSTNLDRQKSIDLHANDLRDIKVLRETPAYGQYWYRRLREKRDAFNKDFHELGRDKCDAEQREVLRNQVALCEDLMTMMQKDESISLQALAKLIPVSQS